LGHNEIDIPLEDVDCPLGCPRSDEVLLVAVDRVTDAPEQFAVVRCRGCGLQRTNPRPTARAISAFYPDSYSPHATVDAASPLNGTSNIKRWLYSLLDLRDRRLPARTPGRLLEVGCASGGFLLEASSLGWRVEGIEFSEAAAARATALGFDVRVATIETAAPPTQQVDIIVAWMVLEHLHDPVGALSRMRSWLAPGGLLVVSVPDVACINRRIFKSAAYDLELPRHLFHFTPATISRVLKHAGWKVERLRWQRNAVTPLRSLEYFLEDREALRAAAVVKSLRLSKSATVPRLLLNWLAGITRQSGRMEVWATVAMPGIDHR
jgi:SAM-dependent methyltransferase